MPQSGDVNHAIRFQALQLAVAACPHNPDDVVRSAKKFYDFLMGEIEEPKTAADAAPEGTGDAGA